MTHETSHDLWDIVEEIDAYRRDDYDIRLIIDDNGFSMSIAQAAALHEKLGMLLEPVEDDE